MRIALFGGSFNPPHVAHQLAALWVLETAGVDELWLVPTYQHPFDKALAAYEHRLAMCELAARSLGPRAHVSDVERTLGGESVTLRTVRHLQTERPGDELLLVIGSDLAAETATWWRGAELRRAIPFVVVGRQGSAAAEAGAVSMPAVSSTDIRRRLTAGGDVTALLPGAVLDYIRRHRLYGAGSA